ncbi:MAG: branched-chain amino acid ABC transporter permease [Proteobacteria bacterium]|nr:MAG: branched-chain amino acid ABC transporter permease [Pseudomonadota bacterium]TDJ72107.1 MAG: branched-chain amino acid ABC transporter permease [Pseudomonadota bacterium]
MNNNTKTLAGCAAILLLGIAAPFLFPNYTFQLAVLWMFILFALTWDTLGGQMGYNSLGNILFFGAGMYICVIVQIAWAGYDVAEYTAHFGAVKIEVTYAQYYGGLIIGLILAALGSVLCAVLFGRVVFGLRGPYFAIGTLGIALAAGELVGTWDYVGGGGGITVPFYPGDPDERALLYYFLCFPLAISTFVFLGWLYSTRFGLAINAIRDDEEKAEGMGIHTLRYKTIAWMSSAFFLGISGGIFGNMVGFVEPLEVAFPVVTFGIFMVVMVLLGGKGTLWGPVLGATVFHVIKEATWTYMLGWQWVALGALIIINIVVFQQGILGWAQEKWPERFGIKVEDDDSGRETG